MEQRLPGEAVKLEALHGRRERPRAKDIPPRVTIKEQPEDNAELHHIWEERVKLPVVITTPRDPNAPGLRSILRQPESPGPETRQLPQQKLNGKPATETVNAALQGEWMPGGNITPSNAETDCWPRPKRGDSPTGNPTISARHKTARGQASSLSGKE